MMFDNNFHGYYIHGRSPFGQAEVSAQSLEMALEFESTGKAHMRGMTEQLPDLQTFEIFMSQELLENYKK